MNHKLLQGFIRIGVFVGGCSLLLIPFYPPDSAEFVISMCSTGIGLALIILAVIAMRVLPEN